jgi:hypothetical protein
MNLKWIVLILLCAACGNRPSAEQTKTITSRDSIHSVKPAVLVDTPAGPTVPDTMMKSPPNEAEDSTPGPTVVFTTDLNNDSIPDTIALRTLAHDTSFYDSITISLTNYGKQSYKTPHAWFREDERFQVFNVNALPTDRFFLARNKQQSVLVLFGYNYEDGRGAFDIINIENNSIKRVFDQEQRKISVDFPEIVKDLDSNGRFDFAYAGITEADDCPEKLHGCITSYNPAFVYTVDDSCVLNKPLMKKYNQDTYVFAGYEYNGSIKVFCPSGKGKCRLWKNR